MYLLLINKNWLNAKKYDSILLDRIEKAGGEGGLKINIWLVRFVDFRKFFKAGKILLHRFSFIQHE